MAKPLHSSPSRTNLNARSPKRQPTSVAPAKPRISQRPPIQRVSFMGAPTPSRLLRTSPQGEYPRTLRSAASAPGVMRWVFSEEINERAGGSIVDEVEPRGVSEMLMSEISSGRQTALGLCEVWELPIIDAGGRLGWFTWPSTPRSGGAAHRLTVPRPRTGAESERHSKGHAGLLRGDYRTRV